MDKISQMPQTVAWEPDGLREARIASEARNHFAKHPLPQAQAATVYNTFDQAFDTPAGPDGKVGRINVDGVKDPVLRQLLGSGSIYRGEEGLRVGNLNVQRDDAEMRFSYQRSDGSSVHVIGLKKMPDGKIGQF